MNYFDAVIEEFCEISADEAKHTDSGIVFGTIASLNPLTVELQNGVVLPTSKFFLTEAVEVKPVNCPAIFTGQFRGQISGTVTIQTPSGAISGAITGDVAIDGTLDGTFQSSRLWEGFKVGDAVQMTSHNKKQNYMVHRIAPRT